MRRFMMALPLTFALGACAVSQQQEVEMGDQYAQQIDAQLPIITDPEINRYVNVLGDSIARLADSRELTWTFRVVDSREVNAFAVPGGHIYINRGLIERAQNMSQVAGVLGHEIGHVVRRHSVKQMQKQQGAQVGVTLGCILINVCGAPGANEAINVGAGALFAKFSRSDEAEADAEGVKNVVRAGIDPNGIPEMFQILLDERQTNPGALDAFFSTHPLEESRIKDTQAQIAKIDPAILKQLRKDSPNFQAFKRRLLSLPPSPPTQTGQ